MANSHAALSQSQPADSAPWTQHLGVGVVIALSLPIAAYGLAWSFTDLVGGAEFRNRLGTMPVWASMHFIGGGLALLIGGLQFVRALRQRYVQIHRWVGRVYLLAVSVAGCGGLAIATISYGGLSTHIGFGLLALLWLASAAAAYVNIRRGDVAAHQRWMIRNFALTFAAVTLRIELGTFQAMGFSFDEAYATVAWSSWVANSIVAEWWLLRSAWAHRNVVDTEPQAVPRTAAAHG